MTSSGRVRRTPGKGAVLGLMVLTAGLLAVSVTRSWVWGTVADPVLGHRSVAADGTMLAPAALGLTLAAGAGALAAGAVGRWGRVMAAVVVTGCAIGVVGSTVGVGRDPGAALDHTAAAVLGQEGGVVLSGVTSSPWLWISLALAVLMTVEGLALFPLARRWAGLSTRYDAPATPPGGQRGAGSTGSGDGGPAAAHPQTPAGEDVPDDGASGPNRDTAQAQRRRAARSAVQDWDRLSAGDDPTR